MILRRSNCETTPFGRQIIDVHPDASSACDATNENWFIATLDENDEEEVYWKGNSVIVTSYDVNGKSNFLKKCFTVDSLILDVLYAEFYLQEGSDKPCKCLCVLEKEFLNVFTNEGELFVSTLPFKVRRMWPVYHGVCLEREPSNIEIDECRKGMPTLFSLTHPLEDVKPIVYRRQDSRKPNYFTDTQTHVVFTHPDECLLMTYDSVIGVHSIWKARKATEQDFPETSVFMDKLPEFCFFSPHSSHLANSKDLSRMSLSPLRNKRHSCPPIPFHGKVKNTPLNSSRNGSQSNAVFSPVAPFRAGVQQAETIQNKVFHELSMNSIMCERKLTNSLLSSCDSCSIDDDMEPLPPDVCLEQVWQETVDLIRHGVKGQAEKGFLTKDFYGNTYLGYILKDLGKLKLLLMKHLDKGLYFEKVFEIDCLDVGNFRFASMYLLLDTSYNLQMYSGKLKVVTPEIGPQTSVEKRRFSFAGKSFSITDEDGFLTCLEVPELCQSELVKSCIDYLKEVFTFEEFNSVYAKYYVMFNDKSPTRAHAQQSKPDWDKFVEATFNLFGFCDSALESLKESVAMPSPPQPKRPKKSDSLTGMEDWEYLLSCQTTNHHSELVEPTGSPCDDSCIEITLQSNAPMYPYITTIFLGWHQLYEELKLNVLQQPHLMKFAQLLHFLAKVLRVNAYANVYETDYPHFNKSDKVVHKLVGDHPFLTELVADFDEESSFFRLACQSLLGNQKFPSMGRPRNIFTSVLSKIYSLIFHYTLRSLDDFEQLLSELDLEHKDTLVENIIDAMFSNGFSHHDLELLPIGYKLPIKEILHHYNSVNDITMSRETAIFLGREDIVALRNEKPCIVGREGALGKEENEDKDGMSFDTEIFDLRFNQDLRVTEVKRLLNSSVPIDITLVQKPDVNDHAFAKEEEAKLLLISNRTMSLPVARGMFTLGTSEAVKSEVVSTPELDLTGRSTTNNKIVLLSQSETPNPRLLWPSFHNGVAAGLKIALGSPHIDATWILLNKLKYADLTADHAGFLLALGLSGHLSTLPKLQLHDYLVKGYELTTVALLLGVAAAQIGSKNADAHVMSSVHLDSLLPQTALELSIPQSSQVAAIISIGLLFFNSVDSHLVKVLLFEIGRSAGPDLENSSDRESHALAAGIALGMMMIGQGKGSVHVADINVESMLYHYIFGGQRKDSILSIHDKHQSPSCQIQEGDLVNTDVTGPAAIIALSLIFLRTNESVVADWLYVPVSENMTDILKPTHALLRMLAYNLVMWDGVVPTKQWLGQFITNIDSVMLDPTSHSQDIHYILSIITGCFFALAIKFAGSCNKSAFNLMFPWLQIIETVMGSSVADELGAKVVLEHCLDSLLISISLVMAGSGNVDVLRVARRLHKRCSSDVSYGNHMAVHMAIGFLFLGGGRYTLKTDNLAIAALLCSLYPKWPVSSKDNRFHLQALRHLYVLACEPRLFVTRDVDTREICYSPLEVTLKETDYYSESSLKMLSPCFIPELKYIKDIKVVGPRYWPIIFKVNSSITLDNIANVVVKKKAGYLSYSEDPKGKRNLLGSTFTNQSDKLQLIKSFNSSPYVTMCAENISSDGVGVGDKRKGDDFFSNMLYECVTKEKLDVYEDYVALEKIMFETEHGHCSSFNINGLQQIMLLYVYYMLVHPKLVTLGAVSKRPLINQLYTIQLKLRLENVINTLKNRKGSLGSSLPYDVTVAERIVKEFDVPFDF